MDVNDLISKINGDEDATEFQFLLTGYGRVFSDIDDVTWIVKKNITDLDADAIMVKKMSNGSIEMDVTDGGSDAVNVSVKWVLADYNSFTIKETYFAGLFIKWNGQATSDEKVNKMFKITIVQDFIQD